MHSRPRAKINLTLSVTAVRPDGFHELESIFLRIGLADELTVSLGDRRGRDELTVTGLPGCPIDGNLVLRAFALLRRALGSDRPPLVAHLDKRIPMQAGLGGGSSDGAAAIDAALQMWGAGLSPERLDDLSLELGSDVPFFVRGGSAALVSGRGEVVERIGRQGDLGVLLVTPPFEMATGRVFARYDELGASDKQSVPVGVVDRLPAAATELRDANDLWPAAVALEPGLGELRDRLEAATRLPWLMSGSGSTLFALYPSADEASAAGRELVSPAPAWLAGSLINAVDLIGPDPTWRHQWPTEQ